MCQREGERGKRQDRVAIQRKDELEKADLLSGSGAVNSAGVVCVKILAKVSRTGGRNGGRVTEVGACRRSLFCILHQNLEQRSLSPQAVADYY